MTEAKLNSRFWTAMLGQPPEMKLALAYLITCETTDILGVWRYAPKAFAFATGLQNLWLDRVLKELPRACIRVGERIWLPKHLARQIGRGPALSRCDAETAEAIETAFYRVGSEVQEKILVGYPELTSLGLRVCGNRMVPQTAYTGGEQPLSIQQKKGE